MRELLANGEQVVLGRFVIDDHEAVHSFASDVRVCRYMSWGPNSESDTRAFLTQSIATASDRLDLAVLVDGSLVGSAAVWTTDAEPKTGELGYVLRADQWGRGYGTETARLLFDLGVECLRLERIAATCDVDNTASARVLEKIGMRFEGTHRGHRIVRGERRDHLVFARLIADEHL